MSGKDELRSVETHFKFGENWRSFVDTLSERSIEEAERGLTRLFPKGELQGRRLLDIGCGSGLHMLAAQRLGAAEIPKSISIVSRCRRLKLFYLRT